MSGMPQFLGKLNAGGGRADYENAAMADLGGVDVVGGRDLVHSRR